MSQPYQKVILFNGPPTIGKDTAVRLASTYIGVNASYLRPMRMSFADPLKQTTHKMYGVFENPEYFEDKKDEPHGAFFGQTPRQAYIKTSEEMIKPILGHAHWGRVAAVLMKRYPTNNVFLFSDSGFIDELTPIVMQYSPSNIAIVELFGSRDGVDLSFVGDSRGYIGAEAKKRWPAITTYRVPNYIDTENPDLTMFNTLISGVCKVFLDIKD